jgi:hypothetical protein
MSAERPSPRSVASEPAERLGLAGGETQSGSGTSVRGQAGRSEGRGGRSTVRRSKRRESKPKPARIVGARFGGVLRFVDPSPEPLEPRRQRLIRDRHHHRDAYHPRGYSLCPKHFRGAVRPPVELTSFGVNAPVKPLTDRGRTDPSKIGCTSARQSPVASSPQAVVRPPGRVQRIGAERVKGDRSAERARQAAEHRPAPPRHGEVRTRSRSRGGSSAAVKALYQAGMGSQVSAPARRRCAMTRAGSVTVNVLDRIIASV